MAAISFGGEMKIELTTDCPNHVMYDYINDRPKTEWCRGGTIWKRITASPGMEKTDEDCGECRGTGEVLTYEGQMIVDLVRVWLREDPKPVGPGTV